MLGRSHVACAAAGWAVLAPPVAVVLGHPLSPLEFVVSLAVAAGAGVSPDVDHPDATIAHTHGFVSRAVAEVVERISGGHRHATHWLATGLAVALAVTAAGTLWPRWTLAIALATCGAWAIRFATPHGFDRDGAPFIAAALGAATYVWMPPVAWVGVAVGFGWVCHIVCDWVCTGSGVPLLGPFDRDRHAAHLFEIGGGVEGIVAQLATVATVLLAGRFLLT